MKHFLMCVFNHMAVGSTYNQGIIFTLLFLIIVYTIVALKFCNNYSIQYSTEKYSGRKYAEI